jgi:hypothetical protein
MLTWRAVAPLVTTAPVASRRNESTPRSASLRQPPSVYDARSVGVKSQASFSLAWSWTVRVCPVVPRTTPSTFFGLRSGTAPVTGVPAVLVVAGRFLTTKPIGCASLTSRLASIHQAKAPARLPIDALPSPPEKRSSVR